jgi:hypothetical protein
MGKMSRRTTFGARPCGGGQRELSDTGTPRQFANRWLSRALWQCTGKASICRRSGLCEFRSLAISRAASFHAGISRTREVAGHRRVIA